MIIPQANSLVGMSDNKRIVAKFLSYDAAEIIVLPEGWTLVSNKLDILPNFSEINVRFLTFEHRVEI